MKIAIITITDDAQKLASKLAYNLENDPTVIGVNLFHKNVKNALCRAFKGHDCIICIMASGIVVRNICSMISNKFKDPAVLVIDDAGKHVISLVSGHFGGANSLTVKIAKIIDAEPVITTSTDIHGKIGIDAIAFKYFLSINDPQAIKAINGALLDDKMPDLYVPEKFNFIFEYPLIKNSYHKKKSPDGFIKAVIHGNEVLLKPKRFVVGVGAKKGISQIDVQRAIEKLIQALDLSTERIDAIATAEIKNDESGIIYTASKLNIPLKIVPMVEIKKIDDDQCSKSDFVMNKFGVIGIAEPSALITAGENSKLIYKKTASNGVTVAAAVSFN